MGVIFLTGLSSWCDGFFFQAEDGIRDYKVTGVQTCALPICALAGSGKLNFGAIVVLSVLAFLSADLAWFEAGRRWGNRILHFACGFSEDPSSCVQDRKSVV